MNRLVGELLALSRTGAVVGELQPVAVGEVARDAWALTETADATLVVDDLPDVAGDRSRLARLFENLFRNTVEHGMEPSGAEESTAPPRRAASVGGGVSPEAEPAADGRRDEAFTVRVGPLGEAGDTGFFVEDDGHGFDTETPADLFDPGVSTRADGTGYGLTIVRDISEAHGWTVVAGESESGGARFEFRVSG
jgi:signal transduction histidine kinase